MLWVTVLCIAFSLAFPFKTSKSGKSSIYSQLLVECEAEAEAQCQGSLEDLQSQFAKELSWANEDNQRSVETIKNDLMHDLHRLKQECNQDLKRQGLEFRQDIKRIQEDHNRELNRLQISHQNHVESLKAKHQQEIEKVTVHGESYEDLDRHYRQEVETLAAFANTNARFVHRELFTRDLSIGPLVIYVHNRPHYLRQVLSSLKDVVNINKTELIISHDGLSDQMNALYMQLVHPSRLHRGKGLKSHWWWLMSKVYNEFYESYDGFITFIEEDHVLSPDFLLVQSALQDTLRMLPLEKRKEFWGGALWSFELEAQPEIMEAQWGLFNTGFFYSKEMFSQIQKYIRLFFECDDGWDVCVHWMIRWELLPGRFLHPRLSRVRNVGRTGLHVTEQIFDELQFDQMAVSNSTTFEPLSLVVEWPNMALPREECLTLTPPQFSGVGVGL